MTITAFRSVLTLLLMASQPLSAFSQPKTLPDLRVKQFQFLRTSPQSLKVQVVNYGNSPAASSKLRLTVRKIAGNSVGRTTEIEIPAIPAGRTQWLVINATKILPQSIRLKDTWFRLDVDPDNAISETNEKNNEVWHGLSAEAVPREPETMDTQQLSAAAGEPSQLTCANVSPRWQVCGNRKPLMVGVGIRFNRIDPNGRIVASRSYDDCSKLAADKTIPANIRARAAAPCKQSLQLAASEAAPQ